jgi:outer membrane protein insertion porin family
LGSKSPYLKGLGQQFFYFDLPKTMVGVIGMRLGIGQTFRDDRDALMPITERFFAGGANTLRGFGLDQASPKDPFGNPVGGNVLTLLNLELRFPIAGKLRGVFFSDNGAVYRRLSNIRFGFLLPKNWRYNAGFGFRYDTPLGPLRVDWGFKIDIRPGEPRSRVHVSLGHAF